MDSSEESSLYALNWSYFDRNLRSAVSNFRSLKRYSDVTFLCQDKTLYGHKIILHAGSDYFRELFEDHRASNNLVIYMYHVKGVVLKKLLEYLYCGEVQVEKKYLPEFIMLGQSLKVKGLVNRTEDTSKQSTENDQMKFKRKKLEEYILTKNKKSKGDAGENDELTLPDGEDASTDEEPEQDKPKQESLEEKTENPLENADSSIILAKPGAPDEDEDQLTSHFHRAVTKSYTRYQRLVANIRKTESGPHEMTKGTRRRCGQCSIQKLEKRTSYYCRTCNIALCRECFEPFHKTFDGGDGSKGAA